jgi:D-3-phosphoglycerate dehydrogenase
MNRDPIQRDHNLREKGGGGGTMRVLIANVLAETGISDLRADGFDVIYRPEITQESLADAVTQASAEVLVVRGAVVNRKVLESGSLRLVVVAGVGYYNYVDLHVALARGVYVANCPGMNAAAVAELAFGLMLALDRRIPENVADLRRQRWNRGAYIRARGLYGRTLGLVGLGHIGREMIPRAHAFGMPVVAWSRSLTAQRAGELGVIMMPSPLELAAASDVVSVHVALTEQTRRLINRAFFEAMRPGVLLINTARAEVLDQEALIWAAREKGVRAGLDVFEGEPVGETGTFDGDLFQNEGIIGTHHIGGGTEQAWQAVAAEVLRVIRTYRDTGIPANRVGS